MNFLFEKQGDADRDLEDDDVEDLSVGNEEKDAKDCFVDEERIDPLNKLIDVEEERETHDTRLEEEVMICHFS